MNELPPLPTFLKWAGGKRRILAALEPLFPEKIDRYFEPFLGGGSVFFYIKEHYDPKFCMISDINADLVLAYKIVRDDPQSLLKELVKFKNRDSSEFYYRTRDKFNSGYLKGVVRAASFIYMNKACYSGLFRVNSRNEFNVPYGNYKRATMFDKETILHASSLLQGVHIEHLDYRAVSKQICKGDFVYLDPCYDPIKRTSFVQYTPDKFSDMDRQNLASFVKEIDRKGGKVLLSNNDLEAVRELYPTKFNFGQITAPRSLGARLGADSKIVELAISNYPMKPALAF